MRTIIFRILRRYAMPLIVLVIISCDSLKEDFISPGNQVTFTTTEFYTLPGSAIIIDMKSLVKQAFTNTRLTISQHPLRGQLSTLDSLMVAYKPYADFNDGQDQFTLSVWSNGKILKTQTLTVAMKQNKEEFPCSLFAIHDKASVKSGASISIPFRENDRGCGIDNGALLVSVYSNPRFGEGRLIGDSIVVYTPGPEFSGYDEMVYKLTTSSGEITAYGMITLTNKASIQILQRPPGSSIFFINENTGFAAGAGIYKTIDGGSHWNKVFGRFDTYAGFTDIHFIDENNGFAGGFAGYSGCGPDPCKGDYIFRTTDGGSNWDIIQTGPGHFISSFVFTSPRIGFVGYYMEDSGEFDSIGGILKTEDGGETWKKVLTDFAMPLIQFTDAKTGYAYRNYRVYITTDAGDTWNLYDWEKLIVDLAVISKNSLCAIFETYDDPLLRSINTSPDGINWKTVASFPYESAALAFSPSGGTGLAVGATSPPMLVDPRSYTLSIVESLDGGATWKPSEIEGHLTGRPLKIAVPSDEVAYILCSDRLIKYTRP